MERVLSGMRPTGRLHLGHLEGVLKSYVSMQENYEAYYMVADWHAMTTDFAEPGEIAANSAEMFKDWISVGINPEKSVMFIQSHVKAHAELFLLLGLITPVSWLERNPTYKEQKQEIKNKDLSGLGFLSYPVLQAADILIYNAHKVPIGEDQRPHLELTREIGRRFNHLYGEGFFVEPKEILTEFSKLPGIDGRKMSKSYNNSIYLSDDGKTVDEKVRQMFTDPEKIRKNDPGHPGNCVVCAFHKAYNKDASEAIVRECVKGERGCVSCKKELIGILNEKMDPIRLKRAEIDKKPDMIKDMIISGNKKAAAAAEKTMEKARDIMGLGK
ncbi:MAG: tryptophan--tRNA ligase [Candidatus Goldiibacteriota bacterium]